jgi:large subunit ribosomal protein L16
MSLLSPKSRNHRKRMRWNLTWMATRWTNVAFWEHGMKALENGFLTSRQLEAARKVIIRTVKKTWKLWFRVFPDVPYTKKGLEMPMGKGKWEVDYFFAPVKKGRIIFEISGFDRAQAEEIIEKAGKKLPIKVTLVSKWEIK